MKHKAHPKSKRKLLSFFIMFVWFMWNTLAIGGASQGHIDLTKIVGEWVRPDGGYTLKVEKINPDGTVSAGYFNPSKVHISEGNVSEWKGLIKLFIKLQDKGYPGSTYTLYYYAEKDALAGFYYQAEMQKTFEVVFIKKTHS